MYFNYCVSSDPPVCGSDLSLCSSFASMTIYSLIKDVIFSVLSVCRSSTVSYSSMGICIGVAYRRYTVEPLLYDHLPNHIGVVV